MDAVDADAQTQGTSPESLSVGAEPGWQTQGENTEGEQAAVRNDRQGQQPPTAPKVGKKAALQTLRNCSQQLVKRLVVVSQADKPGQRLLHQNLRSILDSFLKTKTTAAALMQITNTVYGTTHLGKCFDKITGKSGKNGYPTLDGVSLADLDDVDVFHPVLELLIETRMLGGLLGDMEPLVASLAATQDAPQDDATRAAALDASKTAAVEIKRVFRNLFEPHMIGITITKEKRARPQQPLLTAEEKAHKQRMAESATLDAVTAEAWADYHRRPLARRGSFTVEELVHIRLATDPRSKIAFIALMKKMEAEWDSCNAPDAVAKNPPGNASGNEGQEGRGRTAERATLVNSPVRTASLQDLGRRTPSPDQSWCFDSPNPPTGQTPTQLDKTPRPVGDEVSTPGSGGTPGGGRRRRRHTPPEMRKLNLEGT